MNMQVKYKSKTYISFTWGKVSLKNPVSDVIPHSCNSLLLLEKLLADNEPKSDSKTLLQVAIRYTYNDTKLRGRKYNSETRLSPKYLQQKTKNTSLP